MDDPMRIPSERLCMQAARQLQQAISLGVYPVNSRLPPERELAEMLGVSRPTVREAIIVLEVRGLVHTRHNAGVYVSSVTPPEHVSTTPVPGFGPFEVTEARCAFEGEVAALAATTISEADLRELEALVDVMSNERLDQATREKADRNFHITLAQATRNDVMLHIVESLWDERYRSPLCIFLFSLAREIGIDPPVGDHRRILDAMRARDAEGARQAMRLHLNRVTASLYQAAEYDASERARLKMDEQRHTFARRAGVAEIFREDVSR